MIDNLYSSPLLDQSKDLFWVVDHQLCLVYANKAYLNLIKEVTGKEIKRNEPILEEGFGAEYIENWKAYYERGLNGEHFEIKDQFYNPKTNQVTYSEISFKSLTDENQVVVNVTCQSRDITTYIKSNIEVENILDASLDVICSINEHGIFTQMSAACKELWGYEKEELVGKPYIDFVIEEDKEKTNEVAAEIISGKTVTTFENRYKRKDGGIAFNLWSVRYDPQNQIMFCVARNAREKIQKEELLVESEQRFKALVQEGGDMISIIDAAGNYRYTSPTTTAILGITPEQFDGNSVFDFIHPEDIERAAGYMQRISSEKKVIVEPFRLRDGNKEWRWIETVLTNMLDNPAVQGIVANSRDITNKIEEQHRLKLLESVITNTNDAVLITEAEPFDEPGPRILYVNEAFTKMTGFTAEEVIGKTPRILQGPNSDPKELAKLSKAIRNWEPYEITTINYKKNGEEFWINFTLNPVANEKGWFTHWVAIERDVTDQKNKELENQLIAQISANFDLENDFEKATKELCKAIGLYGNLDWVELWTINLENTQMQLTSYYLSNLEDEVVYNSESHIKSFKRDDGLIGKVWVTGEQTLWEDVSKAKDFVRKDAAKKMGLTSVLGIPLIFDDKVLGVISVGVNSNSRYLKNYMTIFKRLEKFIGSELQRKTLEMELSILFDTIPDLISVGDFQGRFLRINKPGCELLGYSEMEILKKGFEDFIHPEDLNLCYTELLQLQKGQDIFDFEVRFITKSGEILWLSWNCKAKINEGLIYYTAKNITEEKKLKKLNKQANNLAKVGSWEYDLIENKLFWSDEVYHLHDMEPDTFVPNVETAIDFYKEEHKSYVTDEITKSLTQGVYLDYEAVIITRSKKEKWVRVIASPEFIEGKCVKFIGSFQDTTDRREAESRLKSLSDNIPGVVYIYLLHTDGSDEFKYVSKGSEKIWGYSPEEVTENIDLVWNQVKAGGNFEAMKQSISDSIENKSQWYMRFNIVRADGEKRILQGFGTPEFLSDGTVQYHSVVLDITEEVKNEELLEEVSKIAKIGTWETDLVGNNHFKSLMIDEILELEPHQAITDLNSAIDYGRADYQEKMKFYFENCISQGISFDFEAVIVTAKKNEKWVRFIGSPKMIDGKHTKIIGSLQDISSLKETETRLQAISNNLPGVVYQYLIFPDGTDKLRYVSGAVEQVWGFTPDQVLNDINLVWNQVKAGGDFEGAKASIAKSIETQSKWTTTIKYMKPNGELRTHLGNGMPSFLADGTIVFNSIILDVTQEVKNEKILEQTAAIAKIGSWEMNLANQNKEGMYWSPMVYKILDLDSSYNPTYSGGLELIIDDSQTRIQQAMDALMNDGKEYDEEVQMQTGKGSVKWVRLIGKCEWVNNEIIKIYGSIQDINEKKIAEDQLVSLLNERNNILESIGDAFFAVDEDWTVTYWNNVAEKSFQKNKNEIVGKNLWEVYQDAIESDFYTKYHYAMETMENQSFEAFYEAMNQWLEVTAYPSKDGLSVYFKDITQRKKASAEIAKSEEKRRLIMNGALDAIISIDTNETITFWNPQAEVIFGWKAEEVMGRTLSEMIIPEPYRKYHVEGLKNYLQTGEGKALNVLLELSAIRKNGEEFPIELTVIPIKQGDEEFFCAFIRDITLRKKSEREIKKANDRFEKVTEATNDTIWDWDIESGAFFRSNAIDNFLGVGASKVLERKDFWNDNFHKEDISKIKNSIQKALEDSDCIRWEEEYRILNNNNEIIFVKDRGLILRNKNGKAIRMVGAMTNITELKEQERELIELNQSLNEQARELKRSNEELEQFAFIASHDLQEPLRMITSFMDQLKRKYAERLDEKGLQYIHFATDGAKRMKQIILDLLLYSRANKPTEQIELINLDEIVSEYTQLRRKVIAEKKATITFQGLPSIKTYRAPIIQAFHCLLDNALKYVDESKPPRIEISAIEKGNVWQFAIKDNGIGIDSKFYDKIFIIFQRLQNRKEDDGTGIGLPIAKRSIEFLGGEIWVESEIDKGSTFYFTILKI